jgi:hypothetical protein
MFRNVPTPGFEMFNHLNHLRQANARLLIRRFNEVSKYRDYCWMREILKVDFFDAAVSVNFFICISHWDFLRPRLMSLIIYA